MPEISPWIPLDLDPDTRVAIDDALGEIAQGVAARGRHQGDAHTLAQASLFFAYLGRANGSDQQLNLAGDLLDDALDALENTYVRPGLYGGIAGIGWIAHHLGGVDARFQSAEDRNQMVDEFLFDELRASTESDNYDLIGGLVGYGVYFLDRLPLPSGREGLQLTVERLVALAEMMPEGACWHTPASLLPEWQRRQCPTGYYNFGMAHGIPGILVLLARCVDHDVARPVAGELLERGVSWLLTQHQDDSVGSRYPSWKEKPKDPGHISRVAWCYGDTGPAWSLMAAGSALRRPDWFAHGRRILEECTRREDVENSVRDVPLCHGAAGLLHMYHRASRLLGSRELELGARHWLARTLKMRTPGRFVGGYGSYNTPTKDAGVPDWGDDASFLTGVAGIGLALLACISSVEPKWDRLLLLS
ncbi:MAG TPA: lanthionine synthetase C family protein [Vicinamibacterales bacterium]|nr:lanthionine synthetase C family protein [Vicinamibacterales bacterium]